MRQTVSDGDAAARRLFRLRGYTESYVGWFLEITHEASPALPRLPAGVAFGRYGPERERQVMS